MNADDKPSVSAAGNQPDQDSAPRAPSLGGTLLGVAASFFGVRGSKTHARDMSAVNPVHVILAGVFLAGVFVFSLLSLVRWVVG